MFMINLRKMKKVFDIGSNLTIIRSWDRTYLFRSAWNRSFLASEGSAVTLFISAFTLLHCIDVITKKTMLIRSCIATDAMKNKSSQRRLLPATKQRWKRCVKLLISRMVGTKIILRENQQLPRSTLGCKYIGKKLVWLTTIPRTVIKQARPHAYTQYQKNLFLCPLPLVDVFPRVPLKEKRDKKHAHLAFSYSFLFSQRYLLRRGIRIFLLVEFTSPPDDVLEKKSYIKEFVVFCQTRLFSISKETYLNLIFYLNLIDFS